MKNINGSLIGMMQVCQRETWLHANGIRMEHTSETVAEGKLIHETTYPQRSSSYEEITIEGSKIDFYDRKNKIVHEIKKSNTMEDSHITQIKYYLYLLHKQGVDATGIIEYPKIRQTLKISLEKTDIEEIENIVQQTEVLINQEQCPPRLTKKSFCRSCSYFDFCWIEELES